MYATKHFEPRIKEEQLDMFRLIDNIFDDDVDADYITKDKVTGIYKDMSYPRYRTSYQNKTCPIADRHKENILELTRLIKEFLNTTVPAEHYDTFKIPKAKGGYRTINAPQKELKQFMNEVRYILEYRIGFMPHDSAYAYIKNRDCKKSIERHQDNSSNWFLKLDLTKFFDNCNAPFIVRQLRKIYPFASLEEEDYKNFIIPFINLVTLNDGLPQGTPISPILTNMLMVPVDYNLSAALAKGRSFIVYTRYADDMLLSSRVNIDVKETLMIVSSVLREEECPFTLNRKKTRYGSKAGSNWNLGIMYNKDNNLTIGYKRKKKLKNMCRSILLNYPDAIENLEFLYQVQGELSYLKNIEPKYYKHLDMYFIMKYHTSITDAIIMHIKQLTNNN